MSIYTLRTELGHYFKWVLIAVVLILIVGVFYSFGPSTNLGGREKPTENSLLAKVSLGKDGTPIEITRGEFEAAWDRETGMDRQATTSEFELAQKRSGLLGRIIEGNLWFLVAQQEGVQVSNADVDSEIDKRIKLLLNDDRNLYIGLPANGEKRPDDPRNDQRYLDALSRDDKSIGEREARCRDMISVDQVRAELAVRALQKKIMDSAPKPSDQDIANSYNEYKVTSIVVGKLPGAPVEQARKKADSYLKEAQGGADFVQLAKSAVTGSGTQNPDPTTTYTFEDHYKVPAEVRGKVENLQPGQITPVIETNDAYYIAKLESVTPKPPAKLDQKTKDDRAKAIQQERAGAKMADFEKKLTANRNVQFFDPEMHGYWALSEAQQVAFSDPAKAKQKMGEAIAALTNSLNAPGTNVRCASSILAQIYYAQGNYEETAVLLDSMLNGKTPLPESADLRVMLGDSLVKIGKKDQAVASYEKAMRMSKYNSDNLKMLKDKFEELKRPDLVRQTDALLVEQLKREEARKALEKANIPAPAPTPAGAPKPAPAPAPASGSKP